MKRQTERRYAPTSFEVREAADGTIGFRGYAAVFNQVAYGEVIRPGAFTKTLAGNPDVRMLVNHAGVPIARTKSGTLRLTEDDRGLLAEVDALDPENPTVAEVMSAMRRGDLDQMSFAFWPVIESRNDDGIRELLEVGIDDGDVSVVTVPWYDETTAELNSLDQAFAELRAGRVLTPDLRAAVLQRVDRRDVPEFLQLEERDLGGWTVADLAPLLDDAIEDACEGMGAYVWTYLYDVSDTWAVAVCYCDGERCLLQYPYTVSPDGVVTLGEPAEVIAKTTYLPAPVEVDEPTGGGMTAEEMSRFMRLPASEQRAALR